MQTEELLTPDNIKLIYSVCHKFENYYDKKELFQVGSIGLINAQKNYKENQNAKFTTYAYSWIWGEINKFIRENTSVKVSRDIKSLNHKIGYAKQKLAQVLMREPTNKDLAQFLEVDERQIEEATRISNLTMSFDEPVNADSDGKDLTLLDTVADEERMSKEDLLFLKDQLLSLPKQERQLIGMRYLKDRTQKETAELLGMSQVQVSRMESKVLTKMKNNYN